MHQTLPFPIAYPYQLLEAARSPEGRYDCLIQCYEAVLRYIAAVQLSDYLRAGCPDPDLNRKLLERLAGRFALGHWLDLIRDVTVLQKRGVVPAFMPEMVSFYFGPGGGRRLTDEAQLLDSVLVHARNRWAHRDHSWGPEEFRRRHDEQKGPLLDRLLAALRFLGHYTLYIPYRRSSPHVVSEALVLTGPGVPPALRHNLHLELAPDLRDRVENETTALLVTPDDPRRQLVLCPLSVFANRDGVEDIFLFDSCDLQRRLVRKLTYRAVRVNERPLEVSPGSDHERLVRQFGSFLALLGEAPAEAAGPPAADLESYTFVVQREVLREQSRDFVGRGEVRQAFAELKANRPRGYLVVRGGPGQGKTAVACDLIRHHRAVYHLVHPTGGRDDVRLILRSLVAQLIPLAGAPADVRDATPELSRSLETLLARAAARHRPLVVVIDALDELPPSAEEPLPFLVTEGLPEGVYFVVTSRPGDRLDQVLHRVSALAVEHDLAPLSLEEMKAYLQARRPGLEAGEVERIAEACQGNPLYLSAIVRALERGGFDLADLPADIEGFFRRATGGLRRGLSPLRRDVLGLLTVARKPLTLRELSQATGAPQRQVHDEAVRPIRPFLFEEDGFSFYHARFRQFVKRELLFEDELPGFHRLLAGWLQRPENRQSAYRLGSLAYHLHAAGERDALPAVLDRSFLREKVKRQGYAVLEDVELLSRALLEAGDAAVVERCVALVEGLRAVVGGDVIEEAGTAVRGYRPGPASFRSRVIAPRVPPVPGLDVYVGTLPRLAVGADFFELVPHGGGLVVAVGDAPGAGLKSAFIARFLGNVFRRLVEQSAELHLGRVLDEMQRLVGAHDYFETVDLQCAAIDPGEGLVLLANADCPPPVLYSARRGKCDRLPLHGAMLVSGIAPDDQPPHEQRRAEVEPGDVLVLVSDGLTEGNRLKGDPYGHRFTRLLERGTGRGARALGEAILDDWRAHPREEDDADDVTVLVVRVAP